MSGKRRILVLTKRQQAKPVFSSCYSFGESGDKIKTGRQIKTGEQTPSLRVARSCVFSPVSPLFRGRTGRQIKTGRQQPYFARSSFGCFLPVNLVFVVAALLSRCRCGGACPPSRREFYFDGDDSALTSRSFYSPEANIIVVFRALPEKLPNFFTIHFYF